MATTRLHLGQRLLGARPSPAGGTSFRVWAPQARKVAVRLHEDDFPLATAVGGLWEGELDAAPGDDYLLVLDDGDAWPDPHSLWQPGGVRGQSRVLDVSSGQRKATGSTIRYGPSTPSGWKREHGSGSSRSPSSTKA